MTRMIHGKVRGRTIELDEDLGLSDGATVAVSVRTIEETFERHPGVGLLRTEEALADDTDWDGILEEFQRDPQPERGAPAEEP